MCEPAFTAIAATPSGTLMYSGLIVWKALLNRGGQLEGVFELNFPKKFSKNAPLCRRQPALAAGRSS